MLREAKLTEPMTNESLVRWVIAAGVAGAALIGLLALAIVVMFYVSVPGWMEFAITIALVAGACAYAWTVAAAMGDREERPSQSWGGGERIRCRSS